MEIYSPSKHFSDKDEIEKLKLIKIFTVVTWFVMLFNAFNSYILSDSKAALISVGIALIASLNFLFVRLFNLNIGISFLFLLIGFTIFYFDSYAGTESGTYIFYFPYLLSIANVFSYRIQRERYILLFFILFTIVLSFTNLFTDHQIFHRAEPLPENAQTIFYFNFTFALFSLIYFVYLIIQSNIIRYELLQNSILEEKKLRVLEQKKNLQNEILLAELQHRLKNNLSLMSGLLKMKLEHETTLDPKFTIKECVHAIQLVAHANHLQIFEENRIIVPLRPFTHELISYWIELFNGFGYVGHATIECLDIELNIKQAIPMGLIIHEFLSIYWQECQHLNSEENFHVLIQEDNKWIDVKFYSSIDHLQRLNPSKNQLIESLIEQIDGNLSFSTKNEFKIQFPKPENQAKIESAILFEPKKSKG